MNEIVQVDVCRYRLTEVIFSRLVEEGIVKDREFRNPTKASLRRIENFAQVEAKDYGYTIRPYCGKDWAGFYLEV